MQQTSTYNLYDASAGSGKTYNLVVDYISDLLLSSNTYAFQNILAITFTNKAVGEMKDRIINRLWDFSKEEIPQSHLKMFEKIQEKTGLSTTKIQKKSRALLKIILYNYASFEVSTIDSFTHRILRSFARDLNIPVNFEVQLETEEVLEEAVDRLIAKAGKDKELTSTLIDFAMFKADEDKSWDISLDLNNIAKTLTNENNIEAIEVLRHFTLKDFKTFEKEIRAEIKKLKQLRIEQANSFFNLIEKHHIEAKDFTRKAIPNHFQKIVNGENTKPSEAAWAEDLLTEKIYNKSLADYKKATLDKLRPEIKKIYEFTVWCFYRVKFLKKILTQNSSLSLLTAIEHEVAQIKEERNLLLISEFNKRIADEIKDEEAPYIYFRLGDVYTNFYIDEFQDTSELQWGNLKPLVANALASEKGKVTLVGDAKQSIYRWRGGKAEQFMGLIDSDELFHIKKNAIPLKFNYRSYSEIISFNNNFFRFAAPYLQDKNYKKLFENAEQEVVSQKKGFVQAEFIEAKNGEERDEIYPEKIYELLQNLQEKNHPLKDICILVRKKKQGVNIANYLNEKEIPIVSSETLLLSNSEKVNFLISILSYSINIEDDNLQFNILTFIQKQLKEVEDIYSFTNDRLQLKGQAFFDSLKSLGYYFELQQLHRLPIYEAAEYILRSFNLLAEDAYVQFFLDFIYEYSESHSEGISGLLDLWELKKEKLSVIAPQGKNAVQILTIHKAKGLEFPIVIYPYANEKLNDSRTPDYLWVKLTEAPNHIPVTYLKASTQFENFGTEAAQKYRQLVYHNEMDAMNVFYVALTRAEQQLYIISDYERNKTGEIKIDENSLSGILMEFLKTEKNWEEDAVFQSGEIPKATSTPIEEEEEENLRFVSLAPEKHHINFVTKSGELWGSEQEKAIEEGNLMHYLLQKVTVATDIKQVIEEAILEGDLLQEEATVYKQKLNGIVSHPDLKDYYSKKYTIFNEKEVLYNQEYKRLDRLCLSGKEAIIIDYKTGQYATAHEKQIQDYANAIENMGYKIKQKLILYLNDKIEIKNIP